MWPFNRNNLTDSGLPPEVDQYYKDERRGQRSVAFFLAGISLVVSLAVISGIYFGGRVAYRRFFKSSPKSTEVAQTPKTSDKKSTSEPTKNNTKQQSTTDTSNGNTANGSQDANQSSDQEGQVSDQAAVTDTPSPTPASRPLPRTGPEADL